MLLSASAITSSVACISSQCWKALLYFVWTPSFVLSFYDSVSTTIFRSELWLLSVILYLWHVSYCSLLRGYYRIPFWILTRTRLTRQNPECTTAAKTFVPAVIWLVSKHISPLLRQSQGRTREIVSTIVHHCPRGSVQQTLYQVFVFALFPPPIGTAFWQSLRHFLMIYECWPDCLVHPLSTFYKVIRILRAVMSIDFLTSISYEGYFDVVEENLPRQDWDSYGKRAGAVRVPGFLYTWTILLASAFHSSIRCRRHSEPILLMWRFTNWFFDLIAASLRPRGWASAHINRYYSASLSMLRTRSVSQRPYWTTSESLSWPSGRSVL